MNEIFLSAPPSAEGVRVDVFLTDFSDEILSRSVAQRLLKDGLVTKESGAVLSKNYKVQAGDVLVCCIPAPVPTKALPEDIPINIVYEDEHMLVVNKSRGLVVHPGAGNHTGTLVNALLHHCALSSIGGVLRPGIVHRLDKDTSGLMVVAKNDAAHQALAAQLASRSMGRTYHALCIGNLKRDRFTIDLSIGRHPVHRKKMAVLSDRGRSAVTHVEVLERFDKGFTLVATKLETGRTHQIRVHMAHIGHPVLGDAVYGSGRQMLALPGQALHAVWLGLSHPATGESMEFNAPWPEYFREAVEAVRGGVITPNPARNSHLPGYTTSYYSNCNEMTDNKSDNSHAFP